MANNENLKPPINKRSTKEQREIRSKGGKKSGEVRRAKKTMKEMLDYLLEKEITNKAGETATTLEAMMIATIKKALNGDIRANEFIRDTIGQKPTDKIDFKDVTPEIKVATQEDLKALEKLKNANFDKGIS